MPGLGMRPAHVLSSSYPLSQLFRLHLFPGGSTFYSCSHFYSISNFGACEAVRHGVVTKALPQHRRNATKLIRPLSSHTLRYSEPWHSPNALITFLIFGSHGKGIASLKNQAQDDATAASTTTSSSYTTLAQPCMYTLEVKKSKFIAAATSVEDEAAALSFLSQVRDTSASHNCWAFKIGDRTRFSDDGEPGGTAGRPMLAAITSSGIDHVMVVVTRFFGGTKLGTGGLVRAYGKVTTDCLKEAETIIVKAKVYLKIRAPYDVLGVLYPLLQAYDVRKLDEVYDTQGEGGVTMDLMVNAENLRPFERDLETNTKGRASVSDVHQRS
uniref:Impact N-terminal domain-containing protein n=1 Tax=Physcomitrium patens TaxID=3218 RepID=A0A2K1KC63_PHYPA|nr:uncharacterized protein LOC112284326 isoform X1 [Physcomitrium patens]PNR51365.1 hypothetical protein PHYPA_010551 [Physcomitrium patens]|eukprot:XP_024379804.1 uncharacterized protein LOC112284326 isoform X1 [Physcomitrella patens]